MHDKFEYNLTTKLLRAPKNCFIIRDADFNKYLPKRNDDLFWNDYFGQWVRCAPNRTFNEEIIYARQNIYK